MHYVHNGLVFFRRPTVIKGEFVQAVRYRGLRHPNPFWHVGPVRFQHSRGVKRIPAVAHLRDDVTIRHRHSVHFCTHLRNVVI